MTIRVKAVLVGDSGVGKTSLYQRLEHQTFTPVHLPTVSGSFAKLSVPLRDGKSAIIGLWDTAGQERFRTIVPLYFQRASMVLIVFSLASHESFDHVNGWYELAKSHVPPDARFLLIGNKNDVAEREVAFNEAQEQSEILMADRYIETSAATGTGCADLMEVLAECIQEGNELSEPEAQPKGKVSDLAVPGNDERSKCC
jgi:small GTP-binding protein